MRIYRYKNGDTCPCCGQAIAGKTPEELTEFSVIAYCYATANGLAEWILRPGDDAIEIAPEQIWKLISMVDESEACEFR